MWKLTIEDDQASKTVVPLLRDEYTIGRAENNAVRLTERNISRYHAKLSKPAGRWRLSDLTSYNGCYVNGQRVSNEHEIVHGDLVQLGDYRLQVLDDTIVEPASFDKAVTMPAAPRSQALLGQPDRLVMVAGPAVGSEYPIALDHPLLVGRGEECEVAVNHPSVSRVHAEIRPLGDGRYEIVDRESANGVRVNGVELPQSLLDARDVIELGDVVLKFIPAGDIYVPGADDIPHGAHRSSLGPYAYTGPARIKLPRGGRLVAIGAAVLALVLLAVGLASRNVDPEPKIAPANAASDSATRTLAEAKTLLEGGDAERAARKAETISESSNARKSVEFREIEAAWADARFARAATEPEPAKKRALLDQIARHASVDSARRKRALAEMAALAVDSVDVNELPNAPKSATKASGASAATADEKATNSKVAPTPKAAPPSTLVRKNPF